MTSRNSPAEPKAPMSFDADVEREQLHRQILSSVSHDLKTPMASIIGSLEIFQRMYDRLSIEQQKNLVGVALQEAYRLDNFLTNILDMAKLENGLVKPRRESVIVHALLVDCVTRLGNRLKGSTVQIDPSAEALTISTDSTLLTRAVCLVLDNAVKYGGIPSTINITYGKAESGQGVIRIADNGVGIPDDHLTTVFEKYTRFARGDQQNAGTGLGLAICREIMRLLGGTVKAENGAQGGAVFSLYFPL